ncbi:MAG: HNH nuclease family protein [Deltaproteobacteria bacterium]|nr:HNH nuclease family protein [Deltaproteobacteria bacterium]
MSSDNKKSENQTVDSIVAEVRKNRQEFEKAYRDRALKLFPWICGKCGREFGGKKLQELTVHHKDHNHDNNPPDGSNWELLCIYCHENEHARYRVADAYASDSPPAEPEAKLQHQPFAALQDLLKGKK